MSEQATQRKKVTRSPGYPALSLREAIEKAQILWDKERRHPSPLSAIETHFGFKVGSGAVSRVIAALGKFGLVDDDGKGDQKQYKLSDAAVTILHSPPESPERLEALKVAALLPSIHRELWDQYGGDLPSDENLRSYLIVKRGFNPSFVSDFLANFRDSLAFASVLNDGQEIKQPPVVEKIVTPALSAKDSPPAPKPDAGQQREKITQISHLEGKDKMLAQYTIPLGANQATLVFTGQKLTAEDFDALADFVEFSKKQFMRADKITVTLRTDQTITEGAVDEPPGE